jgi:hypothetical protein
MGFGGSFFSNNAGPQQDETTGYYVKTGPALQLNVGARIVKRFIPYLMYEHGFLGAGRRFDGGDSPSAAADLIGIGFRYIAGDVDSVGFLTDISVGARTITVKNGPDTYKISGLEFLRLGLGAEIRITTLFTLSPMAYISGGQMTDTQGQVTYSVQGSTDGITRPPYTSGTIPGYGQTSYVVVGIGCGAHFDIFGK